MKTLFLLMGLSLVSLNGVAHNQCKNMDAEEQKHCEMASVETKAEKRMIKTIVKLVAQGDEIDNSRLNSVVEEAKKLNPKVMTDSVVKALESTTSVEEFKLLLSDSLDTVIPVLYGSLLPVKQIRATRKIIRHLTSSSTNKSNQLREFFICAEFTGKSLNDYIRKYENLSQPDFEKAFMQDFSWEAPNLANKCLK